MKHLFLILMLASVIRVNAQQQTGFFRTSENNTNYHQFSRTGGGAAVYINQTDNVNPILRLSSKTGAPDGGVVFTVENSGNVGVGTKTPKTLLHITSPNTTNKPVAPLLLSRYWLDSSNTRASAFFHITDGQRDQLAIAVAGIGSPGNNYNSPVDTAQIKMVIQANGNVGIGTRKPGEKLSVNGNVRAQEIKVEQANWPDYVFDSSYQLLPLKKLEDFINKNKHLPEIPAASDVTQHGIELGANQALLLKKIEELTLHIIAIDKRVEELETENKFLKKEWPKSNSKVN